jgi:uncharacterized protein
MQYYCPVKRFLKRLFPILFIAAFLLTIYGYLESRWLKTNRIEIAHTDIPENFKGKKIVFISDIHHGPLFSQKRVKKLVDRINKLEPDIVLMGGDYIHWYPKNVHTAFEELKNLSAKLGVYGVLGNSDHWQDPIQTQLLMNKSGFHLCENNSFWVKDGSDSIKIGGVGDWIAGYQKLNRTTKDVIDENFCILLFHHPDYLEALDDDRIDLTFSGHTHGGQVTFFALFAFYLPSKNGQKYRYGLVEKGNRISYISSGVGTVIPPIRFFCRPEIVEVTLK